MPAAASETSGNIWRGPQWNSSGSSAFTTNWLNENPPGAASGTNVDRR